MNETAIVNENPGNRPWTTGALTAVVWAVLVGCFVLPLGFLPGVDGYFHVAVAEKMAIHGPVLETFPWATESIWVDNYFDKEWLFHLLLRCFIPFGRIAAAKITVLVCVLLTALAWWRLYEQLGIRRRFWWLLVLPVFSAGEFLQRLTLCRPHILSLALLAVCLTLMLQRRAWALAMAMVLYALSYTGHWQMVGIAVIYDCLYFFLDAAGKRRQHLLKALPMTVPVLAGMILGEIVHPHFPANVRGLWVQNVLVLKSYWQGGDALYSLRPQEMRPFPWKLALAQLAPLLVGLSAVGIDSVRQKRRWRPELILFAVLTLLYLVMCLRSQRFLEYLIPAGVSFLALYAAQHELWPRLRVRRWAKPGLITLALFCAAISLFSLGVRRFQTFVRLNNRPHYADAAAFLRQHLSPGDIVFTHSWSDPPVLFMQAPQQRYLVFLDPFFMYAHDPEQLKRWKTIKRGSHPAPLNAIRKHFKARAVFIRGDQWKGKPVVFKLQAQLEQELGRPEFVSRQGDLVFLIPVE